MTSVQVDPQQLINRDVQAVFNALTREGATVRFVGGCVRNALLGVAVTDIDLAIDRPPKESQCLLEAAGLLVKPIGMAYGTVLVVMRSGRSFEVTSLRQDIATDGRRATVKFGTDWTEDAKRRDFTMNALYADRNGIVLDPLGGLPDLKARRVRFIGSPTDRIREDYLRILRFFRFQALYGTGAPDAAALDACRELRDGLRRLSAERVGGEMRRILGAPDPAVAIQAAYETGVLRKVFPTLEDEYTVCMDALVALERAHGFAPTWQRRWMMLDRGKVERTAKKLALSRKESAGLTARRDAFAAGLTPLESGYTFGYDVAADVVLVRGAIFEQAKGVSDFLESVTIGSSNSFPLTGADLLAVGVRRGPEVGRVMTFLESTWLACRMGLSRDQLLEMAKHEARVRGDA